MSRRAITWLSGVAVFGAMMLGPGVASAVARDTCTGTATSPGVLVGNYHGDVLVKGACVVSAGPAEVHGTLTVSAGSTLLAAFGLHGSRLTVLGDLRAEPGATVVLGCKVNPTGTGLPCFDDPNPAAPTLASHSVVDGSLIEDAPLGVVVHNSAIGGNVSELGGGGGHTCTPSGAFAAFMEPVYSDYEDTTIGGSLEVSHLVSCWLGVARVHLAGSARFRDNSLDDPDAIEVLDNHIGGDLACYGNSMMWDTADEPPLFALFPRRLERNTVGGARLGQCVHASKTTETGPPAPGPF